MDKERAKRLIRLYAWPAVMIFLGLVLVFSPDTASALIAKVIGWLLVGIGICVAAGVVFGGAGDRMRLIVAAVLCLGIGIFVAAFPLVLAEALGRFFGVFLILRGISGIRGANQKKQTGIPWQYSMGTAVLTLAAGIILTLLPLTLSRILLNICGAVLVVIGIVNIIGTWRESKALESGSRPAIIDADE